MLRRARLPLAILIVQVFKTEPGRLHAGPEGRVYTADQISNTVSVIDAASGKLLGAIVLGQPRPNGLGARYSQQLGVHGLGVSPDGSLLAVVSVTSNAVTIIETETSRILGTTYVGRAPHEPAFSPDGQELWVAVRGENYVSVMDPRTLREKRRVVTANGVAMIAFRPDGRYAFANSSNEPELDVVDTRTYEVVKRIAVPSAFSPNLAVTPDGREVWLTLKDVGQTVMVDADRLEVIGTLETGPVTNHVNFARSSGETFAYVTVGGENAVKVYRLRRDAPPQLVATIPVGDTPHGVWPSADNSHVYVGEENADSLSIIEVRTQRVVGRVQAGQSPQAVIFAGGAAAGAAAGALRRMPPGRIERRSILVPGNSGAKAKAVIRSLDDVDLVDISVRGAAPGAMYDAFAVERAAPPHGRAVKLAHLMTRSDGAAEAGAQLAFFAGFTNVILVPAGSTPREAELLTSERVTAMMTATHCSVH
jgi:YVTN family beta-propeller protein